MPLDYEFRPKTYLRVYGAFRPEFVPIHPEWDPPKVIYRNDVKVWDCEACDTYIVWSKPWTYFQCFNPNCLAVYHRHCINVRTRKAIEDGLLERWVCCSSFCLQSYPQQISNLLATIQEKECIIVAPNLTRSQSVGQDLYGPEVIRYANKPKLSDAHSVCWSQSSYTYLNTKQQFHKAEKSLLTKTTRVTGIM